MNIRYNGRTIYQNLSYEECLDILQDFSEKYYNGEDIDVTLIELEDVKWQSKNH